MREILSAGVTESLSSLLQLSPPPARSSFYVSAVEQNVDSRSWSAHSSLFVACLFFCLLSDPSGPGLDTNDSPLSLMPPVLAYSKQERTGPAH